MVEDEKRKQDEKHMVEDEKHKEDDDEEHEHKNMCDAPLNSSLLSDSKRSDCCSTSNMSVNSSSSQSQSTTTRAERVLASLADKLLHLQLQPSRTSHFAGATSTSAEGQEWKAHSAAQRKISCLLLGTVISLSVTTISSALIFVAWTWMYSSPLLSANAVLFVGGLATKILISGCSIGTCVTSCLRRETSWMAYGLMMINGLVELLSNVLAGAFFVAALVTERGLNVGGSLTVLNAFSLTTIAVLSALVLVEVSGVCG